LEFIGSNINRQMKYFRQSLSSVDMYLRFFVKVNNCGREPDNTVPAQDQIALPYETASNKFQVQQSQAQIEIHLTFT